VTLVGENDRKMLKAVIKHSSDQDNVRHRLIPAEAVAKLTTEIGSMKDEVVEILEEEKQEKHVGDGARVVRASLSISVDAPSRTRYKERREHDRA
jgi:hypothetical protein